MSQLNQDQFHILAEAMPNLVWSARANGTVDYFNSRFLVYLGITTKEMHDGSWVAMVHPDDQRPSLKAWKQAIRSGSEFRSEHRICSADGSYRWHLCLATPLRDSSGHIVRWIGTCTDSDDQKRAQESLAQRVGERTAALDEANMALQRANRALRAISRCGELLTRATDETQLLQEICRIVVEIRGDRMAWVGFAEHDRKKTVRPVAQAGFEKGYLKKANITWADNGPRSRGPFGLAIRSQSVVICRDTATDPNFKPWRASALKRGYHSLITLPLVWENQALGALVLYSTQIDAFHAEEIALLKQLAGDLTSGLILLRGRAERERLQKELLQVAEMEQRRIGQDLHDGLGQQLSAITYLASSLQKKLGSSNPMAATEADRISKLLGEAILQVRTLAHGLHPIKEDPHGLMAALEDLALNVHKLYKVSCRFECPQSIRVTDLSAATNLYRIAQEAVNNAITHGKSKHIWIRLRATTGHIQLTIANDGKTFPARPRRAGLGLRTMKYRAASIGATLQIVNSSNKKVSVTCSWPIPPRGHAA